MDQDEYIKQLRPIHHHDLTGAVAEEKAWRAATTEEEATRASTDEEEAAMTATAEEEAARGMAETEARGDDPYGFEAIGAKITQLAAQWRRHNNDRGGGGEGSG